jgi:hypothetical protein
MSKKFELRQIRAPETGCTTASPHPPESHVTHSVMQIVPVPAAVSNQKKYSFSRTLRLAENRRESFGKRAKKIFLSRTKQSTTCCAKPVDVDLVRKLEVASCRFGQARGGYRQS